MPVRFSEKQLDKWVAEAEEGYDVDELRKHGQRRGRPSRGDHPSRVVTIRLTDEELDSLDRVAAEKHLTRSEVMRQAISRITDVA